MGYGQYSSNGSGYRSNHAGKRYDNSMVAHVWAQQRESAGQSNNGNFYFEGPTLYSYGSHFIVGIIDAKGRAWLTTDTYSPTTGQHCGDARRAVSNPIYVPGLTGIAQAIRFASEGNKIASAWVKRDIKAYLAANWRKLNDEAGATLLEIVSRGTWGNYVARETAKADKSAAKTKRATERLMLASAKEWAATSPAMVRVRMMELAANAYDYQREGRLQSFVSTIADAHKATKPKSKLRAIVWERVKLARAVKARLVDSPMNRANVRKHIAQLRRIMANDYGPNTAPLNLALATNQSLSCLITDAPALRPAARAKLIEWRDTTAATIRQLEAERDAARFAEQQQERDDWLSGLSDKRPYGLTCERGGALLRALQPEIDGCTITGGTLETSQGATVPLRHAFAVFAFVRDCRAKGLPWLPADSRDVGSHARHGPAHIRVGHFRVDSIDATGDFVAGCHSIKWGEVERLANSLGVFDCAAPEMISESEAA